VILKSALFRPDQRAGVLILIYLALNMLAIFVARATNLNQVVMLSNLYFAVLISFFVLRDLLAVKTRVILVLFGLVVFVFFTLSQLGQYSRGTWVSLVSAILFSKLFLVMYLTRNLEKDVFGPLMKMIFFIYVVGIVLNFIFTDFFISLLRETNFGVKTDRLVGFSLNANRCGAWALIFALYFWFVDRRILFVLISIVALLLTNSRSFILLTPLCFLYLSSMKYSVARTLLVIPLIAVPFITFVIFFGDMATTFVAAESTMDGQSRYIRIAMFTSGLQLALDNFPLGAGGGTFGSSMSLGSPVYNVVGIAHWATVIDGTGIYDSGLGSILGEYGFLGALLVFSMAAIGFSSIGKKTLKKIDVFVLVLVVFYISFFRNVFTDVFYSVIVMILFLIIFHVRENTGARFKRAKSKSILS
jgi:hypothetical protein